MLANATGAPWATLDHALHLCCYTRAASAVAVLLGVRLSFLVQVVWSSNNIQVRPAVQSDKGALIERQPPKRRP